MTQTETLNLTVKYGDFSSVEEMSLAQHTVQFFYNRLLRLIGQEGRIVSVNRTQFREPSWHLAIEYKDCQGTLVMILSFGDGRIEVQASDDLPADIISLVSRALEAQPGRVQTNAMILQWLTALED